MENRSYEADTVGYRFSLNGQEKDDEIYGKGNATSAEFWEYDGRLGRRWNVDPIFKAYESPYACFGNNPIWIVDFSPVVGVFFPPTTKLSILNDPCKFTRPSIATLERKLGHRVITEQQTSQYPFSNLRELFFGEALWANLHHGAQEL